MSNVPRWGIHNQIKYSPRRSLLKICPQCNKLFIKYNKGYRIYCSDICRANAHREQKKRIDKEIKAKRDKFEHAENERICYAQGLRNKRMKAGRDYVPNVKLNSNKEPDWKGYHYILSDKLRKMGVH